MEARLPKNDAVNSTLKLTANLTGADCGLVALLLESVQLLFTRALDNVFNAPGHVCQLVAQEQHFFDRPALQTPHQRWRQ